MKKPPFAPVLGCVLVCGYWCCATCDAQAVEPPSTARQDLGVNAAAEILVLQLRSTKIEVRENAATALQSMGKNAATALAGHISVTEPPDGATKAITVLAKIGKDVADDEEVRKALVSAAKNWDARADDWPRLQLQLAAIDALGEINKYRGIILTPEDDNSPDTFDPRAAIDASDELAKTALKVFLNLAAAPRPIYTPTPNPCTPTPNPCTPTPQPGIPTSTPIPESDLAFFKKLVVLSESRAKLVKAATLVSAAASPPTAEEPMFSRLTDVETLAASLRKIQVAYLEATKTIFSDKPADQPDDKSRWQLKAEAAYDLLAETRELRDQLHRTVGTFEKNYLAPLVADLADIAARPNSSDLIEAAVARTLNAIFSRPPEKKSTTEAAKKDGTNKKDAEKKGETKKDAAKEKTSKSDSKHLRTLPV